MTRNREIHNLSLHSKLLNINRNLLWLIFIPHLLHFAFGSLDTSSGCIGQTYSGTTFIPHDAFAFGSVYVSEKFIGHAYCCTIFTILGTIPFPSIGHFALGSVDTWSGWSGHRYSGTIATPSESFAFGSVDVWSK